MTRYDPNCRDCCGTGQRDSGGTHPWGEPIWLPCDCDGPKYYECEDCIGMAQHGCYCESIGCIAPRTLPPEEETENV